EKKRAAEKKLRAAVAANPEWQKKWGDAWDQIAKAEKNFSEFYVRYAAPGVGARALSPLYGTARDLLRLGDEKPKESSARLREYRDSNLASLEVRLLSPAPIYPELEIDWLTSGLQFATELLGGDDPLIVKALAGLPPRLRAEQ